jgi:extracellular elastinolytic metalloproteinase
VWKNHPGSPYGGSATTVDLSPWLASATQLVGPNVHAYSDLNDNNTAQASEEVVPGSYVFQPFPGTGCSTEKPCSWSGGGTSWMTNRLQNAVQAFYLANRFHDHLAAAPIDFTDRSFEGTDRLQLETDDGANTTLPPANNANMYTPPDGTSPQMQMYLWKGPSYRAMNGGDDASILYHEYAHGLSNRLVTDAAGAGALNSAQAGAMGEAWSDWYAKDFLVSEFPGLDSAADGDVHMGVYTDYRANSIRRQGLDCPVVGGSCAGFTYGDFGHVGTGPEVHYDGEIWAETLWDLRTAIGSYDARRLVTQALRLSPPEPSFLDMRNAILLADEASGGARRDAIWAVFAGRGMGFYATTTGSDDASPVEDFTPPPAASEPRGTISGRVTDASTGSPLADSEVGLG